MFTVTAILDIEKAFDTTWHTGLLYRLCKLDFLINLIKLITNIWSRTSDGIIHTEWLTVSGNVTLMLGDSPNLSATVMKDNLGSELESQQAS
jgi:hypothetical protein